jgi:glucan biosynthesis protein C
MPPLIPRLRRLAERRLAGFGVLIWPILYLCAIRLELAPRFPENHALVGDWYNHALYFGVFVLGFALAGSRGAWATLERARWFTLGFAVLGWAFLAAYLGAFSHGDAVPPMALRLFGRIVYGAEQWIAIAAIVGFAHRHLNRDNAARRYLTAAIFPVYILHQTVIVVVAHALKPSDLYPLLEGALLVMVTAATCLLSYEAIRRAPLLRPLFGLERAAPRAAGRSTERALPKARRLTPEPAVPQDIN